MKVEAPPTPGSVCGPTPEALGPEVLLPGKIWKPLGQRRGPGFHSLRSAESEDSVPRYSAAGQHVPRDFICPPLTLNPRPPSPHVPQTPAAGAACPQQPDPGAGPAHWGGRCGLGCVWGWAAELATDFGEGGSGSHGTGSGRLIRSTGLSQRAGTRSCAPAREACRPVDGAEGSSRPGPAARGLRSGVVTLRGPGGVQASDQRVSRPGAEGRLWLLSRWQRGGRGKGAAVGGTRRAPPKRAGGWWMDRRVGDLPMEGEVDDLEKQAKIRS